MFQNVGAAAYKEGLDGTLLLDAYFGHPHRGYRTIHVAGTNGKGSVCHTLAAILQAAGYRVGLYTSPHLIDFRERIRVGGKMISKERVVRFVKELDPLQTSPRGKTPSNSPLKGEKPGKEVPPRGDSGGAFSFFELATALAFKYFEEQKVDFAVIEVGLGGRLDCTNIIRPVLSVITNISFDHVQFLGDTLPKIASEKAGIIKAGVPVVIGEGGEDDVRAVFEEKAKAVGAPITFADSQNVGAAQLSGWGLQGLCQEKNRQTILASVRQLREQGIGISREAIAQGFREVVTMTDLMGRWQTINEVPLTICDTAHNAGGLQYVFRHLAALPHRRLHIVFGMVSDKDVDSVLTMLPRAGAYFYFTQASVRRAMPADELMGRALAVCGSALSPEEGGHAGASGDPRFQAYGDVVSAYQAAKENASDADVIYVGGSTFVVADLLRSLSAGEG